MALRTHFSSFSRRTILQQSNLALMAGCRCAQKSRPTAFSLAVAALVVATGTMVATPSISLATSPPRHHQGGAVTVTVSRAAAQTMQGFGASGAWWPNDLGSFPRTVQEKVADLLFSKTGIDLSAYRYNVGGGGVGVTNPTRAPQSFLTSPGDYNWSADAGGMAFLRLAHEHGVPILEGFANSAPPEWTTNSKNCGGQLIPGDEPAYAAYLAQVVRHLHNADGITLSYVSPMNEPDNSFGSCGQEGMAVPVAQRAALVTDLGEALAQRAPYSKVVADESSLAYFQFLHEVPQWLPATGATESAVALAHHGYDYPTDAQAAQVATLGTQFDRPLWMTEICCYDGKGPLIGFGQQYDPTMTSGLWLADTVYQDLAVIGDSQFDWWTALSSQLGCDPVVDATCATRENTSGWNDGLLYYDPNYRTDGNHSISTTKRYWVLGNFSRYVRPGAIRHQVTDVPTGLDVLAFQDQDNWSVVVVNNNVPGSAPTRLRMALPTGSGLRATGAFETSATEDLAPVQRPRSMNGAGNEVQVPSQSVTTYTFTRDVQKG
jgi:O-glycosyl hydrolase